MVGVTGIFVGYIGLPLAKLHERHHPRTRVHGGWLQWCFLLLWRGSRKKGAMSSTAVNLAIDAVQISALILFRFLPSGHRATTPLGPQRCSTHDDDASDVHL